MFLWIVNGIGIAAFWGLCAGLVSCFLPFDSSGWSERGEPYPFGQAIKIAAGPLWTPVLVVWLLARLPTWAWHGGVWLYRFAREDVRRRRMRRQPPERRPPQGGVYR